MDWSLNTPHYLTLTELHSLFCDYFLTQAAKFEKKDEGFEFGEREEDKGDNVINIKVYYTTYVND